MINHLHGQSGTWMGDGSEGTIHEERINAGDTTVTLTSAKRGSPLNGHFKIRPGNDRATTQSNGLQDYYFECTIQELNGNVSVGVVTYISACPLIALIVAATASGPTLSRDLHNFDNSCSVKVWNLSVLEHP